MNVLKFGGSSVANATNINKVVDILQSKFNEGKTIVVVSALGGVTDELLHTAAMAATGNLDYKEALKAIEIRHIETVKELIPVDKQSATLSLVKKMCNDLEDLANGIFLLRELSPRTKDSIVSFGELLSSQIIAAKLKTILDKVEWVDSRQLIKTDSTYTNAIVNFAITNDLIKNYFTNSPAQLFLIPGFIASNENEITTTLGRGGSDYTAAIVAAAVDATSFEVWTDVSGMMTADPRLVPNAKVIPSISYKEAMELSHFGAKVIYPPTIQPVMKKNIPVWVKNTFAPQDIGTVIKNEGNKNGTNICGISSINKIALLSLEGGGMVGIPGFSKRLFEALANHSINVILITQSSSEHSICVAVEEAFVDKAKAVIDQAFVYEIETGKVDPIITENNLAIVALVGDNMKNHSGISGKMFASLGKNGINIRAIAQGSSERNISAVINVQDVKKAINILHEDFFETSLKQINIFIVGVGNVGGKLMDQLAQQQQYLLQQHHMQLRVVGIANSRKMLIDHNGVNLLNWKAQLDTAVTMNLSGYVTSIKDSNLRNSVFVDVTANEAVSAVYHELLQKSIAVVACNKIAASSPYHNYEKLKNLAREFNCQFLFETNVGAGLPIIGTLNDLLKSGDKINKMEAVLSGTLNFVFNNYDGSQSFAKVVKQAQDEGYTEPDPRLDLSGTDVMRKIMILARESGELIEMEHITNNSFMPASCMVGSVDDFYVAMEKEEAHFKAILQKANEAGAKLKFVAQYENGKAAVGLQHIAPEHNLYHLYGKDNIVLFYTNRYPTQPLVVKGAGAGADVTASGVFADIMRATKL
jgi:bifunctional aspartokinase / homoserine dehydrogenase 1